MARIIRPMRRKRRSNQVSTPVPCNVPRRYTTGTVSNRRLSAATTSGTVPTVRLASSR
jgi:hypothetical protein